MVNTSGLATGFCFTINNYTHADISNINNLPSQSYRYIIYGIEQGEQGTPHLQGYIHYQRNVRFSRVKKDLPRAHIEARKGSIHQAVEYCKKEALFTELGEYPLSAGDASKQVWSTILSKAQKGEHDWIMSNYPKVWINLSHKLESLRVPETAILQDDLIHEWWHGTTGTGKSSALWRLYPDHFQKDTNKWWCGYTHESVVAIEEWSPKNECTGSNLKIWADRYPFTGQIKGGSLKKIRPRKLIVLSNYEIDHCFTESRDIDPLRRRFTVLRFPDDLPIAEERAKAFHLNSRLQEADTVEEQIIITEDQQPVDLEQALSMPATTDLVSSSWFNSDDWASYASDSDLQRIVDAMVD